MGPQPRVRATVSAPGNANDTAFRRAERYWKNRSTPLDLSLAFDLDKVDWEANGATGSWTDRREGRVIHCRRIKMRLGNDEGKGKEKESCNKEADQSIAIIFPELPGLVLYPSFLSPHHQRALVRECFRHTVLPNLTSLSPHYQLPLEGLWKAHEGGDGQMKVPRIDLCPEKVGKRVQVDFEGVNQDNWKEVLGRGEQILENYARKTPVDTEGSCEARKESESTVDDLLAKLRWTNIGWHYNWTSKCYDFDRGKVPVPSLIDSTCRHVVRSTPWDEVFVEDADPFWANWSENYNPEAGIINFDSLTAHQDQSEVNAIRPLVSLSIGHSAVFLVGGQTRDIPPLAMILRSGDALVMSGKQGRRVFHGLPRVLTGTLPSHLGPDVKLDELEEDWKLFGEYLAKGARININVREVF